MVELKPQNSLFNDIGHLDIDYTDDTVRVAEVSPSAKQITIYECDLSVEKAIALRDWLNEVLP